MLLVLSSVILVSCTLSVVGVECSISETARRTQRGRKLAPGAFETLQRRGPQGRAHIWVVFSCKGTERGKWLLAIVVLWRKDDRVTTPVGPSRRVHFRGVCSKTPNSSPRCFAIGCFQRNQYVPLSSSVLVRAIAFQQTVLPPSRALMRSAIPRKLLKMTDFSKTGSRNIAETCAINFLIFDFGFLFDFYSDRGSTATPSARSNVSWCGLRIYSARNGVV